MLGCLSAEHELPEQGCLEAIVNVDHINRGRTPTTREEIVLLLVWVEGAQRIVSVVGEGQRACCKDKDVEDSEFPVTGSI